MGWGTYVPQEHLFARVACVVLSVRCWMDLFNMIIVESIDVLLWPRREREAREHHAGQDRRGDARCLLGRLSLQNDGPRKYYEGIEKVLEKHKTRARETRDKTEGNCQK